MLLRSFVLMFAFLNGCMLIGIVFYSENFSIIYFRLYYDLSPDDPVLPKLCDLSCEANLDLCDIQRLPGNPMENATYMFPMNWRFLPTLDPQVNVYLSRDLDSEFNEREIAGNYLHYGCRGAHF